MINSDMTSTDEAINIILNKLITAPVDPESLAQDRYLESVRKSSSSKGLVVGLALTLGGLYVADRWGSAIVNNLLSSDKSRKEA